MTSPACTAGNMEAGTGLVHGLLLRCCCSYRVLPGLCRCLRGWVHGLEVREGTRQSKWESPSSLPASGEGLWFPKAKKLQTTKLSSSRLFQEAPRPHSQAQAVPAPTRREFPWEAQVPGLRPCSKCWQDSVGASPARCTLGAHSPR